MHRDSRLFVIAALALIAGPASAQNGPDLREAEHMLGRADAARARPSRFNFTNRLSSTAVFIENEGQFDS